MSRRAPPHRECSHRPKVSSSPPRPNRNGSPPFRRTTRYPFFASSQDLIDPLLGHRMVTLRVSRHRSSAHRPVLMARILPPTRLSYTTTSACFSTFCPLRQIIRYLRGRHSPAKLFLSACLTLPFQLFFLILWQALRRAIRHPLRIPLCCLLCIPRLLFIIESRQANHPVFNDRICRHRRGTPSIQVPHKRTFC